MKTIQTSIHIDADPQTVWSVMDDLARYPEWNRLTADLTGRTTVGSVVRGTLTKPGAPAVPIGPTLTTIVGAREFRWLTDAPGFRAEHYFLLRPTGDGGTELIHAEDFDGPVAIERWAGIEATSPPAFSQMNEDLKARAEAFSAATVTLHPSVDGNAATSTSSDDKTTLSCLCAADQVVVEISGLIHHNHLCGCSQCWKPEGALFAMTAVAASDRLTIRAHGEKLAVVDESQSIRRHACTGCGAHLHGEVVDPDHHFHGLSFIHPELAGEAGGGRIEFAGFVSSVIETGTSPSSMAAIRTKLTTLGIPAYDGFSSEIMDMIAWHRRKIARHPQTTV